MKSPYYRRPLAYPFRDKERTKSNTVEVISQNPLGWCSRNTKTLNKECLKSLLKSENTSADSNESNRERIGLPHPEGSHRSARSILSTSLNVPVGMGLGYKTRLHIVSFFRYK
jgi:hypothetical protein